MLRMRSLSWAVGIALIGGVGLATPVGAQVTNQSDTGGTNTFNNVAPRFAPGQILTPELISTANQLSQDLADAQNAFNTAETEASRTPRRFARGPGEDCVNPALSRLNEAVQASQEFLNGLSAEQLEQLRRTANLKIW
jgi:hypothetical protein